MWSLGPRWHEALRGAWGTQEGGELREGTGLRETRAQRRGTQIVGAGALEGKGARLGALRGGLGRGS